MRFLPPTVPNINRPVFNPIPILKGMEEARKGREEARKGTGEKRKGTAPKETQQLVVELEGKRN